MTRVITLLLWFLSFHVLAAPKSELWPYWNTSDETSSQSISHQSWQRFLDDYLITEGENTLIRYHHVSEEDKSSLKQYIRQLSETEPRILNKAEQYAYWVNLYNAITVDLILDNYPIKSITKLGGFFRFGPWQDDVITISGKTLTLNDIEHRILRPIWNDPRTHYAVNCASLGCPNLQASAFTASNTETLLEQAAHDFINSSKGVDITPSSTTLSSIYDWFREDFQSEGGVIDHIRQYRPQMNDNQGKLHYDYDWSLNQALD